MGLYEKQREVAYPKPILNWLYTGIAMIFIMVMIGGITRLTESGLSMVDWKPIMGTLPPMNEDQWNQAFQEYQSSPEFKERNYHFELDNFKEIFWWEYIHRLFGRVIGLVFIIPFIWFIATKKLSKALFYRLIVILALGGTQGLLGWIMVKSGLVDQPRVSHYRLAAHLMTAFLTISYIYYVSLELRFKTVERQKLYKPFKGWSVGLLVMLAIQIMYGAFVAGRDAGLIHNTWPSMDGYFIHPAATALDSLWANLTENNSMIQFVHRTLAILVFVFVWSIWLESRKKRLVEALQKPINLMVLVVSIQFLLGVFTVLYKVPLLVALFHQVFALVLLLAVVHIFFQSKLRTSS